MKPGLSLLRLVVAGLVGFLGGAPLWAQGKGTTETPPLLLVVMDPLSRELACACVKGYGQRDYRKLAARMEAELKERVSIEFSDDLAETLDVLGAIDARREILVIGDRSLVASGAAKAKLRCTPLAELTDPEGNTTLSAAFVVRSDDPARDLKDILGRKLLSGLAEADEKFAASLAALRSAGVKDAKAEKHLVYTEAALDLLDSEASPLPVAILPSYALMMLQGCGSVKPGNLRAIAKTEPVPFITMFGSDNIRAEKREKIIQTLLGIKSEPQLLLALESRDGFKAIAQRKEAGVGRDGNESWPDWRGAKRDGRVSRLPAMLPSRPRVVWKKGAFHGALAGLSVSNGKVLSAERDLVDEHDVYRCFSAADGELLWRIQFAARGTLDYGQSPRAAPVMAGGRAYLLGAFGDLRCVDLKDGRVVWQRNLPREFRGKLPTWGMCSPPIVVGEMVVVNPGSAEASLAALDCESGETCWVTPGAPAAYSAFVACEVAGRRQIVGYDARSLGGWDAQTGKRLWTILPAVQGDFNVPTPIVLEDGLVVSTENNGTRLYHFDEAGVSGPNPVARCADLAPDTSTPVVSAGRLFGAAHQRLYCLDLRRGLKTIWERTEEKLGEHASFIADDERVLVITMAGELILLDSGADEWRVVSRLKLFEEEVENYAHPALAGTRLYARGAESIVCVDLAMEDL